MAEERPVQSINFDEYTFQLRKHKRLRDWWVLMLVNTTEGNQTKLVKTTDPLAFQKLLPIHDNNKVWEEGIYICVGPDAEKAENLIQVICGERTGGAQTKQIRGIISRSVMCELVSHRFGFQIFANYDTIFGEEGVEDKIYKVQPD
jgi:hypothetical protein